MIRKKICILGCGVVGGIVAAKLSSRSDVIACDIDKSLVRRLNKSGLKIYCHGKSSAHKFPIVDDIRMINKRYFDLVILATKSYDSYEACKMLSQYARPKAILSLQNGINNGKIAASFFPRASVCCAVTTMAAHMPKDGRIDMYSNGDFYFAPYVSPYGHARSIAELFRKSGFKAHLTRSAKDILWPKLIFNSVMNPITVITRTSYDAIKQSRFADCILQRAFDEGVAVARRYGAKLYFNPKTVLKKAILGHSKSFEHKGSLYYDIMDGKKNEIEYLTGELVLLARKVRLRVPALETIYSLAKIIEKKYSKT
jgi:2-dehydropantoate 2-reductase